MLEGRLQGGSSSRADADCPSSRADAVVVSRTLEEFGDPVLWGDDLSPSEDSRAAAHGLDVVSQPLEAGSDFFPSEESSVAASQVSSYPAVVCARVAFSVSRSLLGASWGQHLLFMCLRRLVQSQTVRTTLAIPWSRRTWRKSFQMWPALLQMHRMTLMISYTSSNRSERVQGFFVGQVFLVSCSDPTRSWLVVENWMVLTSSSLVLLWQPFHLNLIVRKNRILRQPLMLASRNSRLWRRARSCCCLKCTVVLGLFCFDEVAFRDGESCDEYL